MSENNTERYSLSKLQQLIKHTIEENINGFYWVSAEIAEIKINYSGHCYLELIEKDQKEDIRSKIRAVIWSAKARMLLPYFEDITGQPLAENLKVLFRIKVEYHEVYGLSLIVYDIDPAYTLGEMALKRRQIIERLESEGVIDLNKGLKFPLLSMRIAVISSEQAAGYQDFTDELQKNRYGYKFVTKLYPAVMQGKETEPSVTGAINRIFEDIEMYDLVVIVRGGGSQSDLSWFDNYNIAFLITQLPVPVLTGIGHEKDLSVTDIVAFMAFKTPTAVADFIINKTFLTEEYLIGIKKSIISLSQEMVNGKRAVINKLGVNMSPLVRSALKKKGILLNKTGLRLSGSARSYLSRYHARLSSYETALDSNSLKMIKEKQKDLDSVYDEIKQSIQRFIKEKQNILSNFIKSIDYLSPNRVLDRGYSITLYDGKAVKSPKELSPGSEIDTILSKGRIKSKVSDLNNSDK